MNSKYKGLGKYKNFLYQSNGLNWPIESKWRPYMESSYFSQTFAFNKANFCFIRLVNNGQYGLCFKRSFNYAPWRIEILIPGANIPIDDQFKFSNLLNYIPNNICVQKLHPYIVDDYIKKYYADSICQKN